MSRKKEREKREREKNAIYSGHLRLWQQPRAAHALRSDQDHNLDVPDLESQLLKELIYISLMELMVFRS